MHILETNSMEFITFWSLITCNILYITILLQGGMINNCFQNYLDPWWQYGFEN
jgi:hypothetical protein